jgi:hypothetical protein
MEVTQDQYQLPIAWGYSAEELSRKCGKTKGQIQSTISHWVSGKTKVPRFIRVDIEEDEEK